MFGIVSGAVAPPVVKSVAITLAFQPAFRAARWSVTVTGPICPEIVVPGFPEPIFGLVGTVIVRPSAPVNVSVTVLSAATATDAGAIVSTAAARPTKASFDLTRPPTCIDQTKG